MQGARHATNLRMEDVARLAGVSKMTVSRAMRPNTPVAKKTRDRIQTVIDELGYVPDQMAARFSVQRSGFVAVLMPVIDSPAFSASIEGISEICEANGLQLLLGVTGIDMKREEMLITSMLGRRPEAIVLTGRHHTLRSRTILGQAKIPVIEMWDIPPSPLGDIVGFSIPETGRIVVKHFVDRGYRKLGFIGSDNPFDSRTSERERGFVAATKEFGLPECRVLATTGARVGMQQGAKALVHMLEQWPDLEAIMCVTDAAAVGAILEARRRDWKVPDRIAIAGFGDFYAGLTDPSLTTVRADWRKLGQEVGKQVNSRIVSHGAVSPTSGKTILIDIELVVRGST